MPRKPKDPPKRPYRMRRRAETQEETRLRIVEAAVALHEEIGPRATTVSAIAERAGVQRLTVYRHLPDEEAVIHACSSHWAAANPAPEPAEWAREGNPLARARTALQAFFAYYSRTAAMWRSVRRDAGDVEAVRVAVGGFDAHVGAIGDALADAIASGKRARAQARATLRHALAFATWQELEAQGLEDPAKVALVMRWVEGVAGR